MIFSVRKATRGILSRIVLRSARRIDNGAGIGGLAQQTVKDCRIALTLIRQSALPITRFDNQNRQGEQQCQKVRHADGSILNQ